MYNMHPKLLQMFVAKKYVLYSKFYSIIIDPTKTKKVFCWLNYNKNKNKISTNLLLLSVKVIPWHDTLKWTHVVFGNILYAKSTALTMASGPVKLSISILHK